jgi:uncharacterized membrane protein YqjE
MAATHMRDVNREVPTAESEDTRGRSSDRPISQILQDVVRSVTEIVECQIRLAAAEIKKDLAQRSKAAASLLVAGVVMLYAVGLLLLGVVYALSTVWPAWLAAIVPAAVLALLGVVLFFSGRQRMKQRMKLQVTSESVEDNLRWLKNRTK